MEKRKAVPSKIFLLRYLKNIGYVIYKRREDAQSLRSRFLSWSSSCDKSYIPYDAGKLLFMSII